MPTDVAERDDERVVAEVIMPDAASDEYASAKFPFAQFDRSTGDLIQGLYIQPFSEVSQKITSAIDAVLNNTMVVRLMDDLQTEISSYLSDLVGALAKGSALAAPGLRSGLVAALQPSQSFEENGRDLISHLRHFGQITKDWPEFSQQEFPRASVDRILQFMRDVWLRTNRQGQATLLSAFCGPSEDGAVNCQWKRQSRFLGLTVPPQGPFEAYFSDDEPVKNSKGHPTRTGSPAGSKGSDRTSERNRPSFLHLRTHRAHRH